MTWSEDCQRKRMSAAQALEAVTSGARVWIQSGCGTPSVLVDALVARAASLRNVEIIHMKTLGAADYTRPEYEGHFRHRGLFLGDNVREAVCNGRADYTPIFLSEIEGLFETGALPLDVVLMQVSPPDAHGFVSLGTTVDCTLTAIRYARTVIAEVNQQMPRTHGETTVHVSHISAVVETDRPLLELEAEPCTELHMRVARNVAALIPNGATLQTGIGGISEAVLHCLTDKRDLQARPGDPHRDVSRRRDRFDGVRRHQRRTQDAASRQGRGCLCAGHAAALRFHPRESELRVPLHQLH
jgi:acyl-CoA hydrolase